MEIDKKTLLEEIALLKAGYVACLNDLDVMKNWEKAQLEALYATKIGRFKMELMELELQLKCTKKKIQFCHQYLNKGEEPDFDEIELRASTMLDQAIVEIHEARQKVIIGEVLLSNLASPEHSMELRKVFRNIAKSLHPDVNPNLTSRQLELWHSFQSAYKEGDLDKLKALEIVYAEELEKADTVMKEQSIDELELQKATLKQGIAELEAQKKKLNDEFPFTISELIRDDEWVEEQQAIIKQEIENTTDLLEEKTNDYNLLKNIYNG